MFIMKRTFAIVLVLFICGVVSCLLFPAIWHAVDWNYPPARVFRRIWMIVTILGFLICHKQIGLLSPAQAGFTLSRSVLRNLLIGLATVLVFLTALSFVYVLIGAWTVAEPFQLVEFIDRGKNGLVRGTLVASIEEYIFRGLIFLSLSRHWGWKTGALISSLIFASLHFFEGRGLENITDPDSIYAGFHICGLLLTNMANEFSLFPDAVGLFVVGLALCYGVQQTGSLWYSAGLHGGWIFYFTIRKVFFLNTGQWSEFYIGSARLFNGLIPILAMLVIFPMTFLLSQKRILKR